MFSNWQISKKSTKKDYSLEENYNPSKLKNQSKPTQTNNFPSLQTPYNSDCDKVYEPKPYEINLEDSCDDDNLCPTYCKVMVNFVYALNSYLVKLLESNHLNQLDSNHPKNPNDEYVELLLESASKFAVEALLDINFYETILLLLINYFHILATIETNYYDKQTISQLENDIKKKIDLYFRGLPNLCAYENKSNLDIVKIKWLNWIKEINQLIFSIINEKKNNVPSMSRFQHLIEVTQKTGSYFDEISLRGRKDDLLVFDLGSSVIINLKQKDKLTKPIQEYPTNLNINSNELKNTPKTDVPLSIQNPNFIARVPNKNSLRTSSKMFESQQKINDVESLVDKKMDQAIQVSGMNPNTKESQSELQIKLIGCNLCDARKQPINNISKNLSYKLGIDNFFRCSKQNYPLKVLKYNTYVDIKTIKSNLQFDSKKKILRMVFFLPTGISEINLNPVKISIDYNLKKINNTYDFGPVYSTEIFLVENVPMCLFFKLKNQSQFQYCGLRINKNSFNKQQIYYNNNNNNFSNDEENSNSDNDSDSDTFDNIEYKNNGIHIF